MTSEAPASAEEPGPRDEIPPADAVDVPGAVADWRRLDRRMLLVHPFQTLIRALPALLALFLARAGSSDSERWELIALPLVLAYGVARWFTTRYRIDGEQIQLQHGVITKQTTTARLDKVRTVDLTAQIWHRLLGLAKVEISTAGTKDRLVLDALSLTAGRALRAELLHRAAAEGAPVAAPALVEVQDRPVDPSWPAPTGAAMSGTATAPIAAEARDEDLLRMDPAWVRFAPFTMSGFLSAAALLGIGSQFANQFSKNGQIYESAWSWAAQRGLVAALVLLVLAVTVLAMGGYVLSFWGFHLSRNRLGSLHARRGLLTTRETSIDSTRLRGVEIGEPAGLRLVRGARLKAVTTGLGHDARARSDVLAPPAPAGIVRNVALAILGDAAAVRGELVAHGAAARRRRHVRALVPNSVLAITLGILTGVLHWWTGWFVAALLLLPLGWALARSRYAALGHRVTDRHVVVRSGALDRDRVVLQRDGIVGWTIRESFFQRRAGVATLVMTTGAGRQHYEAIDVTPATAYGVIAEVHPTLVEAFASGRRPD
ncbi:MAG: PH domain-containing protein [Intrasporangium sp.]|uniref:PH domain-containing protein n=1 Tax=Intrasporangium sp. TaxID=1925024 RepID=UPI003F81BBAF